jgi:GTP-binding protein
MTESLNNNVQNSSGRRSRSDLRNVAIIAHVDHGKTTLVDALLRQSKVFRDNQAIAECVMDSNDLERERGITILAKNTAITYKGIKINIIDTPGHADFSGEVERVINMADGCLLLVDAAEGPMPQTRYVLKQAFAKGIKPILVINKIDRSDAQIANVLSKTQDLFLELATSDSQLEFPILYASGRGGTASSDPNVPGTDMEPLFEAILKTVPPPVIEDGPFQMLVSNLDYDNHKGKLSIGRIWRGRVAPRDTVVTIDAMGNTERWEISEVSTFLGLKRIEVPSAEAGDIVTIAGVEKVNIGDTLASPDLPEALPRITIGEPTVEMNFCVNTSPFAGREGHYCTTRQLRARLYRELETNLSLRVQDGDTPDVFRVCGRGELHLSVLIETMRREGYELAVSKPEAIVKEVNGKLMEPVEALVIDTKEGHIGVITEMLSKRRARLTNMYNDGQGNVRMEYHLPTRGLIGFRSDFMTATRGEGVINTQFLGYEPLQGEIGTTRSGVLVASESGMAVTYGLNNAQGRGLTFIEPGTPVYEGQIVGITPKMQDIAVNVCKEKKLTNIRSSTSDIAIKLTPPIKMSLEQSIDFVQKDELVEVTPKSIRLRKKLLTETQRLRARGQTVKVED